MQFLLLILPYKAKLCKVKERNFNFASECAEKVAGWFLGIHDFYRKSSSLFTRNLKNKNKKQKLNIFLWEIKKVEARIKGKL
jgi:hypothetical protein